MNNTRNITLCVTQEQEDCISQLLETRGWTDCIVDRTCNTTSRAVSRAAHVHVASGSRQAACGLARPISDRHSDPSLEECPHCLLRPCVTAHRQQWLGAGQRAIRANAPLRKDKYKKFYAVLAQRGAWNDPRYLARKQQALDLEFTGNANGNIVWSHRKTHHIRR